MAVAFAGNNDPDYVVENPLEAIDGDFAKVSLLDSTQDDGLPIGRGHVFDCGRPVDPAHMPTRLRRRGPVAQPLLDIRNGHGGSRLVSDAFRQLVEALEPGVHQFFPMTVEQNGRVLGTRHLLVICNRLDTLNRAACIPPPEAGRPYRPNRDGSDRIVFSKDRVAGRHLWVDKFLRGSLMSDALARGVVSEGLRGLRCTEYGEA